MSYRAQICSLSVFVAAGSALAADEALDVDRYVRLAPFAEARRTETCLLPDDERLWIQASFDLWEIVSSRYLALKNASLPWIVHHDGSCVFHVNAPGPVGTGFRAVTSPLLWRGSRVRVWSAAHAGRLRLPDGSQVAATARAVASTYETTGVVQPFFNMSLMPLWRAAVPPQERTAALSTEFLTIAQHEMTHTRHVRAVREAAAGIVGGKPAQRVKLHDDAVQTAFGQNAEFAADLRREIELLYRAFHEPDLAAKRRLVLESLDAMRARHARYFTGTAISLGEIEPLFLFLEGAGEWVRFRLARDARILPDHRELQKVDPTFDNYSALRAMTEAQALDFVRGNRKYWVQDHGLALFAVLGQFDPEWPKGLADGEIRSPYAMLAQAVERK